jgi:hypothetical protein
MPLGCCLALSALHGQALKAAHRLLEWPKHSGVHLSLCLTICLAVLLCWCGVPAASGLLSHYMSGCPAVLVWCTCSFWSAAHFLESLEVRRRNIELQMGRDPDCFPDTGPYMFEPVSMQRHKGRGVSCGGARVLKTFVPADCLS